jgi:hypothetical protein
MTVSAARPRGWPTVSPEIILAGYLERERLGRIDLATGPEAETRHKRIDVMLRDAGWVIQDRRDVNLTANMGVAVREVPLKSGYGFADYLLFIDGYAAGAIGKRKATWSDQNADGRWRAYDLKDIMARDKASLDIFWLKDDSLQDTHNLPDPDVIAQKIVEDLEDALENMRTLATGLR